MNASSSPSSDLRVARQLRALGLQVPSEEEALEARLSIALTAALAATEAKKHLVTAAVALKKGQSAEADALLGTALSTLEQAGEETRILRHTLTDRRTATQRQAARWSRAHEVCREDRDPVETLAAVATSLRRQNAGLQDR